MQRYYPANEGQYSQGYGLPSGHVWLWEPNLKKAVCRRIDAFTFWCWRKLLSVLGKSTLNVHCKAWCWSWNSSILVIWCKQLTLQMSLMLGKTEGRRKRTCQRMGWLDDITDSMDMNLGKLRKMARDRETWRVAVHEAAKSWTWLAGWPTTKCFAHTYLNFCGHNEVKRLTWHKIFSFLGWEFG